MKEKYVFVTSFLRPEFFYLLNSIYFVLLKDRSRSEELTLINHQNLFFAFLRDQMPKFPTMPFIRGLRDLTGS